MSCCDDPTAHQPSATAASALKALTTSGISVECPDPIVAAAMLEATQLTDTEREIILGVLGRDELLRRDQQLRVLQLKAELQNLRRKGALKPTTNLDNTGPDQDPDRYCRRCRVELGRVINRGSYCRACRLKVCKACREYSLRTTDWVCTVCKKQMEIQAASGEWMNEFVKRPKRRENRVCLPTADIIKRTIRRSWTISNPTPRWSAMRGSPELRPYNSLPRKQDINNYPSLVLYQANHKNQENSSQENPSPTYRRRSPRRTQSEDIYDDQGSSSQFRGTSPVTHGGISPEMEVFNQRSSRMNPLIKLPDSRPDIERRRSPMRRSNEGSSEEGSSKEDGSPKSKGILTPETARKFDRSNMEKRVSFESHVPYTRMSRPTPVLRTQSLIEGRVQNHLPSRYPAHHEDNSDNSEEAAHGDAHDSREENNPIELCEIEPFSGTVFRKMMVRRRRQNNARNISGSTSNCSTTAENGWRRGPESDLWDILLPEGDDYKLVFINSDGSSKEETSSREEDDNDSTSTASSFPIDECDWDYFEPGTRPAPVINWSSPFGSPRVYRRGVVESPIGSPLVYRRRMRESDTGTDEDNVRQDSGSPASSDSIFQPRIIPEDPSFESTAQLRNEKILEDTSAIRCVHSEDVSAKPCCHACGAPTQFIPIPVPVPIPFPVPTLWPPHEPPLMVFGEQRFRVLPRNLWPYLSQAALIWPTLNANGGTTDTTMPATTDRDTSALQTHKESDIVPPVVGAEEEITGYLECENRYSSSSDSSSDDSDNSGPRVRRMYNVSGTERHSDDALPSSNVSSDNDDNDGRLSHSSVREDDMTSSGTDDTDSDDTGTVADQKSKRFSRIFVVNKNLSSSSNSCSSSSNTDTSDNDTDTELDCTVVLTNVKQLEEERDDVCDSKSSDKDTKKAENEYYFSSPGLSDVSAESVNSSDVDNNDLITKNQPTDDTRKKKVCFDDTDAVEKETINDKVAVIKLNKRDIEAINKEKDLPFGNEFKLIQDEHFKINKDEVDDAVNGNKEITETAVTFSLSEGNINKSKEDNKTHDNIEAASDENVINVEEKTSSESLTKEHLDVVEFSGTTEKAVNDDNKGKTNNKTVLSACSTIQANILFDDQHNENLNLIISPRDDDLNIQNEQIETIINEIFSDSSTNNLTKTDDLFVKNNTDFDTDNLNSIIDTHFLTEDYFETFSHPINKTSNDNDIIDNENDDETTISALNLTARRINDNEDVDTRNNDKLTESAGSKSNDYLAEDTDDNDKDSDVETKDKFNLIIPNLTVENNKVIDTKSFEKLYVFSGTTTDESADDIDTTDNEGNDFMDTLDVVQVTIESSLSNLELSSTKNEEDVKDNIEDVVENISNDRLEESEKYEVAEGLFSDTLTITPKLNKDLKETFDENDRNQKAKEDMETLIDGTVTSNKLDDTDHTGLEKHEDAMNLDDGVVSTSIKELEKFGNVKIGEICDKNIVRIISNDRLEESEKYEVAEGLFSDTLTTNPKLNKDLNKTFDENNKDQNAKEDMETLIDGTVTLNKLDDTDYTGLEKHEDVMNLDDGVVSTSIKELEKFGDVERGEICDENIVSTGLNEEINKIISKSLDSYEKVDEIFERNDGALDLNVLATFSKDETDEEVDKFEISSRKLVKDEKLEDENEIDRKNDTIFDITYTIITDNETIETVEEDQSQITIGENKIEAMVDKELTNIDEKIIEDIDKLDETIAASNLIDTVINFDSESDEYNDDLAKYDTNSYANTVEDLPISQKTDTITLEFLETTEILNESQEKAINDNVDDYIITEYNAYSLAVEKPQEISVTVDNINVTDNEYSSLDASERTEQFIKFEEKTSTEQVDDTKATEYETDRFSSTLGTLTIADDDKTSEYETLSVGEPEVAQRHNPHEKNSNERADESGDIEYRNDVLSSTYYDATNNVEKIFKSEEKIMTSSVDDDVVADYEFEMLTHGTVKKISTIDADDEIEIFAHGTSRYDEELTKLEDKISDSKMMMIDDVTDYEFVTLSSVNHAIKNAQIFTEPPDEISIDQSTENVVDENVTIYEFSKHSSDQDDLQRALKLTELQDVISTDDELSLSAPKTTPRLSKSQEKTDNESNDKNITNDNNSIEYALSSGTRQEDESTENVDDKNVTIYEFAKHSSAHDDLQMASKVTKIQDVISTDDKFSLGSPKTTPRLSKSQEEANTESNHDNSTIENEYNADGDSIRSQTLTEALGKISTDNTDNVIEYKVAILSSAQEDWKNAQKFTKPQEEISTDNAEKDIVTEHEFNTVSLGTPKTTQGKSEEQTSIESTDDNNAIEYALSSGTRKEDESTENVDDENVTMYKYSKHSSAQHDLQRALKLAEHQDVLSTDDELSLSAPKTTPRLSKSQEKANNGSNDENNTNNNNAIEYALSSGTRKEDESTENFADENVTIYKFAKQSSAQDDLQIVSKLTELQDVISTDDAFSLSAPKTTPRLSKSQGKANNESNDDNSTIEYDNNADSNSMRSQTLTEALGKISTDNTDNVIEYKFAILSSAQEDWKNVQKFTKPQEEISTDNAEKDIVTEHEFNTVSLGTPKTTQGKSEEQTSIESTDDNNAIEYALSSGTRKEDESTENVDDENVTMYKYSKHSSAQHDLQRALKLAEHQDVMSTDDELSLSAPKTTPRLSKSQEKANNGSNDENNTNNNNAIEYALSSGTRKEHESTENFADENVTIYEFAKQSSAQDDLQIVSKLTELQDVISTDDEFSLGAPKTTPRLSKSQGKANNESNDDNSTIEYDNNADSNSMRSQTLTEALGKIATENTDDDNVAEYKFTILSSAQDDLKNAQKFTEPPDEISTDNAEKYIVTEHEFNIVSLGTPKKTQGKSEEETSVKSTDDNNVIEYALSSVHGTQKEDRSTENVDDEKVTVYEFAKHFSAHDDLEMVSKVAELQDVISTDDELSLSAPKATPRLIKFQGKANNESYVDNSTIEYDNNADSDSIRSQTLTEAVGKISNENTDDDIVTEYQLSILSSAQDDLKNAQKFTEPPDEISTDNVEKCIVTYHEFNIVSLGTPKTTQGTSEEQTGIKSTDDNNAIEYALSSVTRKEDEGTENVDYENVALYEFAKQSSAQEMVSKVTELQDVINTDTFPLSAPRLSKSHEKANIESNDDNSTIEYEYNADGDSNRYQTLTKTHEKISAENSDDENVTEYKFSLSSTAQEDLKSAQEFIKPQEEISTDNAEKDIATNDENDTKYESVTLPSTHADLSNAQKFIKLQEIVDIDNVTDVEFNTLSLCTPRMSKTLEKTNDIRSDVIEYENDTTSSAYGISKTTQKLTRSQEKINTDEALEFATLPLAESASETTNILNKIQDKANTEIVDYKNTTDDNTCSSTPAQVLGKLQEKIITEHTDDKNVTESSYTLPKFELKSFDTEEINIFEENDKYGETKNDADKNVVKSDYTLSSELEIPEEIQRNFTKPQDQSSPERKTCIFGESVVEINKEFTNDEETKDVIHSAALDSQKHQGENINKESDKFQVTPKIFELCKLDQPRDSFEKFTQAASPGVKFELKPFDTEEINIFEETGETKNVAEDYVLEYDYTFSSVLDIPKKTPEEVTKSQETFSITDKSAVEINKDLADDEKFTRVAFEDIKFELKPFNKEEINIFEENDDSENITTDDYALEYDYTISSALGISKKTSEEIAKSHETISSGRNISMTDKSAVEINKDLADDEKFTRAAFEDIKFELKPFNKEEINIFEENDYSENMTTDDYALEYDYTFSSALGIPKNTSEEITKSHETISSGRNISMTDKTEIEINKDLADDEKFTRVAFEDIKFELKPFNKEEINIFEENDDSENITTDDYALEYDDTFSSALGIPKIRSEEITKSHETISSGRNISMTDKSAIEINKELAHDQKFKRAASAGIKFELKPFNKEEINIFEENDDSENITTDDYALEYDYTFSSALGIPKNTSEEITKSHETISSGRNISMTDKTEIEINKDLADDEKFTRVAFEDIKFELKPFNKEEINIFEENDDSENITTDDYALEYDDTFSSALGIPKIRSEEITKSHETISSGRNISMTDKSAIEINKELAHDQKFKRAASAGIKFELKPFNKEEINIFEENDDSENITTDDYALEYDYTFSSALGIPKNTSEEITKSHETISSGRNISMTDKTEIEINKDLADDEKFTRVAFEDIKFELKPFNKEEINIFEENDDSENITTDDYALEYDDTFSSALGIPKIRSEEITKSHETISSGRNISMTDKSAIEINKELAHDQKFKRAASAGIKFELKPFNKEEINIFEENDDSENITTDDYALEYDYTFSSALGIPKNTSGEITKSHETISSGRNISMTDKSAIEINKELAHDQKFNRAASAGIKFELKPFNKEEINIFKENDDSENITTDDYALEYDYTISSALGILKKTSEEIAKSHETISSGLNISMTDKSAVEINKELADDEKSTRVAFEDVKFEIKPFNTKEINISEENDDSENITTDDYALEYDYTISSALGIPKKTSEEIAKSHETISSGRNISMTDKSALEINKELAHDQKFNRAASAGIKFELKPFNTEEINIFEENDDSDDYALEYNYSFSSAMGIPKKTQGKMKKNQEIISSKKSYKSADNKKTIKESSEEGKTNSQSESPGIKFELKPFNVETISIFEEIDKSGKPVALKDLDIVKNKQDLNYSECSNRTVVYSSFENNVLDISRRHEIIQSFDKTGRVTDCTVDIKSDDDDDEDTVENIDKINLGQTFKFTLRSYGEEEKNIKDSKKVNVLEKIFKKKIKSEKDSPPQQQEIDRLINQMVEAISSEYPTDSDTDNVQLMDVVLGGETPVESAGADDQRALSEWNEIRSIDAVNVEGKSLYGRNDGVQPGAIVCGEVLSRHAARYTSLVMITQDPAPNYQQVSVVTSDTTTLVPGNDVVVRHTNWQEDDNKQLGKKRDNRNQEKGTVTVITGGDTLSAFEEGLADDDSWVENLSHDEEDEDEFATNSGTEDSSSGEEVTLTCSAAIDQEEDLRGYHRAAIDFTLHTIVEESCEESEVEQNVPKKKERPASATDLEKYFFFGLGDGMGPSLQSNREDAYSETSSIYSEGMESLGSEEVQTSNDNSDPAELASSRLEKYFLSGFMGFTAERKDSDGSVGSDSEGRPSPEQRRKRLVRARGTGRSHSSSLDNLDNAISEQTIETQMSSEHSSSSDSENYDDANSFEKPDGQFDTVKRKKNKKHKNVSSADESKNLETTQEIEEKCSDSDEDGNKTPQPEAQSTLSNLTTTKNQQSRDSGFVGSCDDLLREQRDNSTPDFTSVKNELIKTELEDITEEKKIEEKSISVSTPPATSLTRKDSFNNWSSDEETNLMMCKMRQFFKTMVANSQLNASSKPSTPTLSCTIIPLPSPRAKRCKPPQLVYFENELTRLMKTVPGIREDQVREIVEYLSSEDTWSDSYDSSDYTSSDLEITTSKTVLQQQISDSCKQIINKFDNRVDDEGDEGDGGIIDESHGLNKETAFVYQKLVASFEKMAAGENSDSNISKVVPHSSPPLIAKVMHHIGSRLVALMHEVSSGESHASNSPKTKHYHRRLQHKISSASSTTTEDDCPEGAGDILGYEEHVPYNLLPRSRSHDLLVGEARVSHQSISGVSDITEEKEASDCERFSWRGSFESALLATDSRNRLSLLGGEASALAIAAKRRSAGDLLFSNKSLSREQLDRVRSCGSIGGANSEDKLWVASAIRPNRRRSSVPDATCGSGGSADGEDEDEDIESRSTLPRSLQGGTPTTNSLPRLPTTVSSSSIQKSQSHHVLSQNVKSARYRPPGFNRLTSMPKRAVSAPGLQPSHQRRGRRSQQNNVPSVCQSAEDFDGENDEKYIVQVNTVQAKESSKPSITISSTISKSVPEISKSSKDGNNELPLPHKDEAGVSEAYSSPSLASPRNGTKSATTSPVTPSSKRAGRDWHHEEDLDRIVGLHGRASLSTLGARSDSMASVYSGAGEGRYGSVAVRGQVEFGLQYNYKAGALEIQIKQCKDLAPVDTKRNRSDPYVKVYLLPDKSKSGKRKTKVKKHTLNPVFDECLKFHISLNGLESRTLWLTVWHSDMFGRNDFLGEVMMTLENKVFDDPTPKWYNLQERTEPFEDVPSYRGDVIVCLKFVPPDMTIQKKGKRSRGALHVLIKEAKALTAVKANGTSDPFCKSYLLPDKGRSSKQKTPIARRTTNPVWNYTFVYDDVSLQELAERCLELTVWDHDRLASNEFLGGVRFSLGTGKHYGKPVDWMDASGREMSLWKNMLEKPNFWVEGSLSLRSSLESRGS